MVNGERESARIADHIGSPAHAADLFATQIHLRLDLNLLSNVGVGHIEVSGNGVSVKHHLPTEPMFHTTPFDPAGMNEITQRDDYLDRDINRRQAQDQRLFLPVRVFPAAVTEVEGSGAASSAKGTA